MIKTGALLCFFLFTASCKFNMDVVEEKAPEAPEQMRQVAFLSASEQNISKVFCQALETKRSLFRTLHDGRAFEFQLEKFVCGAKQSTTPVTATLKAPAGAAMTFEATGTEKLFFTDVVTSTEGVTHFVCDIVLQGKPMSNTVVINNVETLQLRFGGNTTVSAVMEISHFVSSAGAGQTLADIETFTVHVKPSTVSDFTGLEMDRVLAKRCVDGGKFTTASRQTSLEKVP